MPLSPNGWFDAICDQPCVLRRQLRVPGAIQVAPPESLAASAAALVIAARSVISGHQLPPPPRIRHYPRPRFISATDVNPDEVYSDADVGNNGSLTETGTEGFPSSAQQYPPGRRQQKPGDIFVDYANQEAAVPVTPSPPRWSSFNLYPERPACVTREYPFEDLLSTYPLYGPQVPPPRLTYAIQPGQGGVRELEPHAINLSWDMASPPARRPALPSSGCHDTADVLPLIQEPYVDGAAVYALRAPQWRHVAAHWWPIRRHQDVLPPDYDPLRHVPGSFLSDTPPQVPPVRQAWHPAARVWAADSNRLPETDEAILTAWAGPPQVPAFRGYPARPVPPATQRDVWYDSLQVEALLAWDVPHRPPPRPAPVGRWQWDAFASWTPTGESFGWHVQPEWRVPERAVAAWAGVRAVHASGLAAPPIYSSGVSIVVAGPFVVDAAQIWVAGADQGDIVGG